MRDESTQESGIAGELLRTCITIEVRGAAKAPEVAKASGEEAAMASIFSFVDSVAGLFCCNSMNWIAIGAESERCFSKWIPLDTSGKVHKPQRKLAAPPHLCDEV